MNFQKINEAYSILKDKNKRKEYDLYVDDKGTTSSSSSSSSGYSGGQYQETYRDYRYAQNNNNM